MSKEIPDHPIIRNMERTGYPDGREPRGPVCPVCGREADVFYQRDGEIIGCWGCVREVNYEEVS
ncbi:MAG: hypothetical protein VB071_03225 [Lawsonibacter sp.]|nr:hypothetical protein [Lawsonibacter sp.]